MRASFFFSLSFLLFRTVWCVSMASRVHLASSGAAKTETEKGVSAETAASPPRWAGIVPPPPEEEEEEAPRGGVFASAEAAACAARCFPVENSRSLGREGPFLAEAEAAAAELASAAALWKPSTCS